MNDPKPARGGRYAGVDYFNGGLFAKVDPLELQPPAIGLLFEPRGKIGCASNLSSSARWFQKGSLGKEERHALGAHFTYEADIQKIVRPTIVRPWEERIAAGKNVAELLELLRQLRAFRVLDPACGSGNFLFVWLILSCEARLTGIDFILISAPNPPAKAISATATPIPPSLQSWQALTNLLPVALLSLSISVFALAGSTCGNTVTDKAFCC